MNACAIMLFRATQLIKKSLEKLLTVMTGVLRRRAVSTAIYMKVVRVTIELGYCWDIAGGRRQSTIDGGRCLLFL